MEESLFSRVKTRSNYLYGLLMQKRFITVLLLGFASGIPFSLVGTTLQAWYTEAGLSILLIGSLSLVGQPYIYKFFWAPFFDRFAGLWLGRRRGWIIICQIAVIFSLIAIAYSDPLTHPYKVAWLAIIAAFFSASQDIVVDAYRTELLKPEERGLGTAFFITGYRMAMLISGGLAMIIAAIYGWRESYLLMSGMMILGIIASLWGDEPELKDIIKPQNISQALILPIKDFLKRPAIFSILLFILVYKLADSFSLILNNTFLLKMGYSLVEVGAFSKTIGLAAVLSGSFIGGALLMRLGQYRSLLYFGILQGLSNLVYLVIIAKGAKIDLLVIAIFVENFCYGLVSVVFVAFLMNLCNLSFTAAQFAFLSALAAAARVFVGPLAGWIEMRWGWGWFYVVSALSAVPGLGLLFYLRRNEVFLFGTK